jgi:hypothetical protein
MDVNPDRLNSFMGKMLGDVGAALNASLMLIGDKLGLYKTLAAQGPLGSAELANATKTSERYVREWLSAQAASGYVEYDAASGKFSMQPEQILALADEDSPYFMGAIGNLVSATFLDEPKIFDRSRPARAWAGIGAANACSAAPRVSFAQATSIIWSRSGCRRLMASSKSGGAKVADIGCGHGVSTRLMPEALPPRG